MHAEVLEKIDRKSILEEANSVKVKLDMSWKNLRDVGLQSHKPNLNPTKEWQSSTKRSEKLQYPETYFKYPLFNAPLINRIMDKYGLVRTRIIKCPAYKCTGFKRKLTKRVYIPLMSNSGLRIIVENEIYNFETGKIYLVNTTLEHTSINASNKNGVVIVGCIYE
tara:strand:+ start:604 stop:1098 length:495 start_codon:yes stop_codon:yes gene_type:complete